MSAYCGDCGSQSIQYDGPSSPEKDFLVANVAPRMLAALKRLQDSSAWMDVEACDFELSAEINAILTEVDGK